MSGTTLIRSLSNRFFAALYPRTIARYERAITPRKQQLLRDIVGDVLEIGPGPGSNLRYCSDAASWTGVEPNHFMHKWIGQSIPNSELQVRILAEPAELMQLADESFDVVIGTLVLCSVTDPQQVLQQIRRLLKPGGRYLFIEHVAEPDRKATRRFQKLIRPCWQFCANGCRPDLDALSQINNAGFSQVDAESFHVSPAVLPWFLAPHVAGCAIQ